MYAIIQTGGHQLRVTPGGFAIVPGTVAEPGAKVTLEQVLLVDERDIHPLNKDAALVEVCARLLQELQRI